MGYILFKSWEHLAYQAAGRLIHPSLTTRPFPRNLAPKRPTQKRANPVYPPRVEFQQEVERHQRGVEGEAVPSLEDEGLLDDTNTIPRAMHIIRES